MKYERLLGDIIQKNLFKRKVIVLFGARRTGKTTLANKIIEYNGKSKYINCEMTMVGCGEISA